MCFASHYPTKSKAPTNTMKFTYDIKTGHESGKRFDIVFESVEDALLMLKTFKRHYSHYHGYDPAWITCSWTKYGETYQA